MRILLIFFVMFFGIFGVVQAGCIPDFSVYKHGNQNLHMKFEGLNQEFINGPLYIIKELEYIGVAGSCEKDNIDKGEQFYFFELSGQSLIYYIINFIFGIGKFLIPLILITLFCFKISMPLFLKISILFISYMYTIINFIFYFGWWY